MKSLKTLGVASLLLQLILFRYLSAQPQWIETFFIPEVFSPIAGFLRLITSWIPFSLGLVLVYALALFLPAILVRHFRRGGSFKSLLFSVAAWASPVFLFYAITWGLLYYRQPLPLLLDYDTKPVKAEELHALCAELVEKTNGARRQLTDSSIYNTASKQIMEQAAGVYRTAHLPFLKYSTPSVKMATGSDLLAYMGTSGIYTFWSGEANVNRVNSPVDLPAVILHEMAHQLGFASEDEASYLAWLVAKDHADPLFRYSACYNVLWRSLRQLRQIDSTRAQAFYSLLDSAVYLDAEIDNARWEPYRNRMQKYVISPFYNLFLKANGQQEGIRSYDRVIDLIIFERRKAEDSPISSHLSKNP